MNCVFYSFPEKLAVEFRSVVANRFSFVMYWEDALEGWGERESRKTNSKLKHCESNTQARSYQSDS